MEDFVRSCPHSLLYATPPFLDLLANHLRTPCQWLVAKAKGQVEAAVPFLVKEGNLGTVWNSLPFYGSNGGVLQRTYDPPLKQEMIMTYYEKAKEAGACSATLITNPLLKDHADYENSIDGFLKDERIGQFTHLPDNPGEELIKKFEDPRPRNIRKALKEGIAVSCGNERTRLEFMHRIHLQNMNAIGGLAKSWDFFEQVALSMPQETWTVYSGELNEEPVAALLIFYFNGTVEYFTPVIRPEFRHTQALALVIYEAMKDAVQEKACKLWNWGGTWLSQGGVYDFKKRWGTEDYPYYYYTKVFNQELLKVNSKDLLDEYAGFYVLPFNELKEMKNEKHS